MKGAHKNLKLYGRPTKAKKPIVVFVIPISTSQTERVDNVSRRGKPEANPNNIIINNFLSV